ncbi:exodeoxyribonuclease VII large subunit [Thermoflavimicrobium dichotomicum]|uniref:Exodeoxyribonuclease 7 large subunit n=1 Tax=Thermoflavimicrobium dichotomicum TaxID=46223 RepID=A0A1I3QCX0_9BACL|nr:exodeoxyribonuclease VII large subunit [Thermoflavimicrobium dichotomicum]SFJ30976.1 exodeoxyribonuclease VII large subunit [Thermoflavimicrobium dichotomicum]
MEIEKKPWSVTELVSYLRETIELDELLQKVWVEGEITNFTHHARSGHMYFSLKDEQTQIKAVMFASYNRRLRFTPKNGDRVLVRGRLSVYERDGQVQLYIHDLRQHGIGDLFVAFQQLKEQLEAEGLFDPAHKKALPPFPKKIGVITSASGAAIRDIITTIRRRYPLGHVILFPVSVQGETAAKEVAQAIDIMNQLQEVELLIVGRGGGSIEELWAFNEEMVVRSIFRSQIPVISAVGHETDFTLSDLVADLRAATPTAAAELAVPHLEELKERLASLQKRLIQVQTSMISLWRHRLQQLLSRPIFQQPHARLEQYAQRLDYLQSDLVKAIEKRWTNSQRKVERLANQLERLHPRVSLSKQRDKLFYLQKELLNAILRIIRDQEGKSQRLMDRLDALSPLKVMKRGYSLVYRLGRDELVKSVRQVKPGDLIQVRLSDGKLKCQIWGSEESNHE